MQNSGKKVFSDAIRNFCQNLDMRNSKERTLYIFQGFPQEFYKELQFFIPHLIDGVLDHYPSLAEFSEELRQLRRAFFDFEQSSWIYYEEFIVMCRSLRQFDEADKIVVVYNDLFEYAYPLPLDDEVYSALQNDDISQEENEVFVFYADCSKELENLFVSYVHRHFEEDTGRTDIQQIGFYKTLCLPTASDAPVDEVRITRTELARYATLLQGGALQNCTYRVVGVLDRQSSAMLAMNALGHFYGVSFIREDEEIRSNEADRYLPLFWRYWGADAMFRPVKFYKNPSDPETRTDTEEISQGLIISDILDQCKKAHSGTAYSDVIVTAPTGAGKSVLFQIPAIYLSERDEPLVTIVISPLVALMRDQVKELEDKGINYATFINSNITYEDRQTRLSGIKDGTYSIVYLSPELLLAHNLRDLFGERKVGLMIVDEAHLVTSWGRDFRVDYWFLGSYIAGIRQNQSRHHAQMQFPVVCLTATAVYGGEDDVIDDLQESLYLNCEPRHIYIGYVVRDNIDFSIRSLQKKCDKEAKANLVAKQVASFVERGEKTIVYFPYTSQIEDVYRKLVQYAGVAKRTVKYYGSMRHEEKQKSQDDFHHGESIVMLATKAFGMGVNISDIVNVYHYAPTGTLADYVQEIGRAARKLPHGHASIDFAVGDMNSVRALWGMSRLRQYQLKNIMKKLYGMYKTRKTKTGKNSRNLLFSADEFGFLFDNDLDNTVKSGLMLLSADLYKKYQFKVITMRPKALLTLQYVRIPPEVEDAFLQEYGSYCKKVNDVHTRREYPPKLNAPVVVKREGNIYEVALDRLWQNDFDKMTFAQFKYKFFNGELFDGDFRDVVFCPNLRLTIHYTEGYEKAKEGLQEIASALRETFSELKQTFGSKMFSFEDFHKRLQSKYGRKISPEYGRLLLGLFVGEPENDSTWDAPKGEWKFLTKRGRDTTGAMKEKNNDGYMIMGGKNFYIEKNLMSYLKSLQPNENEGRDFVVYIPILYSKPGSSTTHKLDYKLLLASILQIFDLATYDVEGGRNPQIFVRINDPGKLQYLTRPESRYQNRILTEINNRHENAIKIMNGFMTSDYTTQERWKIIEQYFLGNDEWVHDVLTLPKGAQHSDQASSAKKAAPTVAAVHEKSIRIGAGCTLQDMGVAYWRDLGQILDMDLSHYEEQEVGLPSKINFQVDLGSQTLMGLFLWDEFHIMVLMDSVSSAGMKRLQQDGWLVQVAGNEDLKLIREYMKG